MVQHGRDIVVCLLLLSACAMADHVHDLHTTTPHGTNEHGSWQRISLEDGPTTLSFSLPNPQVNWEMVYDAPVVNLTNQTVEAKFVASKSYTSTASVTKSIAGTIELKWASNMIVTAAEAKLGITGTWIDTDTITEIDTVVVDLELDIPPCSKARVWKKAQVKTLGTSFDAWDHRITCQCTECSNTSVNYCNREVLMVTGRSFEFGETTIDPIESLPASSCMTTTTTTPPATYSSTTTASPMTTTMPPSSAPSPTSP